MFMRLIHFGCQNYQCPQGPSSSSTKPFIQPGHNLCFMWSIMWHFITYRLASTSINICNIFLYQSFHTQIVEDLPIFLKFCGTYPPNYASIQFFLFFGSELDNVVTWAEFYCLVIQSFACVLKQNFQTVIFRMVLWFLINQV